MTDWIQILNNLREKKRKEKDFGSAATFNLMIKWLEFNHSIEEIFDNKDSYNDSVKKELLKLERRKKIDKINGNN